MYDADLLFNTASTLRASIVEAFDSYPDLTLPTVDEAYIYPGDRPLEGCDTVSVSVNQIIPATNPNEIAGNQPTCHYLTVVEFNIRLVNCHPVREDGQPLSLGEAEASAQRHYQAAWVLWSEMLNRWANSLLLAPYVTDCEDITFEPFTFNNPSGGRLYADLIVRVNLRPVRV